MTNPTLNSYELSRAWFDFCFENPEIIQPAHTAIYFFAVEHCNRLGWKSKFGFPTQMTMDAIGIKKHQTYIKYFNDLCEWGFFKLIQKSTNQYSANIICLQNAKLKNGKALDKALVKHMAKQTEPTGQSTGQSKDSIDKQINKEQINKEQGTKGRPSIAEFLKYCEKELQGGFEGLKFSLTAKYDQWTDQNWRDGNGNEIKNWKTKIKNTIPYLRNFEPNGKNQQPGGDRRSNGSFGAL
jgi:hypothetical protein